MRPPLPPFTLETARAKVQAAEDAWPSRDPSEEWGGANIYEFVGNSSVNHWDYLGLDWSYAGPSEIPLASMPPGAAGWPGATGLRTNGGFWSDDHLAETGTDHVTEYEDPAATCGKKFCAKLDDAKTYKVPIVSYTANDQLGIKYTATGYTAIKAHEARRVDAYKLAHDAYIDEINKSWRGTCNPLCSSKSGEAKTKLLEWIASVRKRAHKAFFRYTNHEMSAISQENIDTNLDFDPANSQLVAGIKTIHTPGVPTPLQLPKCPTCK